MQISDKALADILFNDISGSYIHNTNNGTAPTSTTAYASLSVCLAMYDNAHAAASFTLGSNSSRHTTRLSNAPLSTTAYAN